MFVPYCAVPSTGFTVFTSKDTTQGRLTFTEVGTNNGNGFNTTTGEFTCSLAGSYVFSLTLLKSPSTEYASCKIFKDTTFLGKVLLSTPTADGWFPMSVTVYVHLKVGDKVFLDHCAGSTSGDPGSSFTGYLLHMDYM